MEIGYTKEDDWILFVFMALYSRLTVIFILLKLRDLSKSTTKPPQ